MLSSLLAGNSPASAQVPDKQWDYTLGGDWAEKLTALQPTPDGGFLLGGTSESGVFGEKSQANRGNGGDYWLVKLDAQGQKVWDQTYGGTDDDALEALVPTLDGGYVLAGYSFSGIGGDKTQASQGGVDYWLVKVDATGRKLWDRTYGGADRDILTTITATADGGFLLGGNSDSPDSYDKTHANRGALDYWVLKLDAQGNKVWDRTVGGDGHDFLQEVLLTADGGYLLAGTSSSTISGERSQASRGGSDFWLVKLDAQGTVAWDRVLGGNLADFLSDVEPTADGGYLLVGASNSGIGDEKTQPSQGKTDGWVVKLNAQGVQQWDRTYGGTEIDELTTVKQTADGSFLLAGNSNSGISGDKTQANQGEFDYWLVKLDAQGNKRWDQTYGGSKNDYATTQLLTLDGGCLLGGYGNSDRSGDKTQPSRGAGGSYDYWLIKVGPAPLATSAAAALAPLRGYPNPMTTSLTVHGPLGTPYQLLTPFGQVVGTGKLSPQPLDVQTLPAGLYLLREQVNGRTLKLVKE